MAKNRKKTEIGVGMSIAKKSYLVSIEHEAWGWSTHFKESLLIKDAIDFDLNNIDRVYSGSVNFMELAPSDRKFLIHQLGVSNIDELDERIAKMPEGSSKTRAIDIFNTLA